MGRGVANAAREESTPYRSGRETAEAAEHRQAGEDRSGSELEVVQKAQGWEWIRKAQGGTCWGWKSSVLEVGSKS